MTRRLTEQERKREVAGWRASGQSQKVYARARGYSAASLARWAREVGGTAVAPAFVRLEVAAEPRSTDVVVEVSGARVRVSRGFDPGLLREVVAALASGRPA